MWKVNKRAFPKGIQFGGGSDWFILNHKFIAYLLNSDDEYLRHLQVFYNYTLLPSESFFHTVLLNSEFCDKFVNTNLKFVNWKRDLGCACNEAYSSVDWCGCSPNFLNVNDDLTYVKSTLKNMPMFFARKFDPIHSNHLINIVDQSIFGVYSANFKSLNSYWHNVYDCEEKSLLEKKLTILLDHFRNTARSKFIEILNVELSVKTLYSYFEADLFKGYVLKFEVSDTIDHMRLVVGEIFFRKASSKHMVSFPDSKNDCKNSQVILFKQSLVKIEISTEFDVRERKFLKNYASIIGQTDNPELLMEFDPLDEPIDFLIEWFTPNGKCFIFHGYSSILK